MMGWSAATFSLEKKGLIAARRIRWRSWSTVPNSRSGIPERVHIERVLLPPALPVIEAVVIVGIIDMELGRADSNDRSWKLRVSGMALAYIYCGEKLVVLTIFGMQVSDLEGIFAPFHDVVVSLEQVGRRSQFWSWKLRDRAYVQSVDHKTDEVEEIDNEKSDCEYEYDAALARKNSLKHCSCYSSR